uniref:Uncharacterized protein MANES_02G147000 n=1 Tax=Rhizophora mucronata TaxID=61149 RepID=A0A2P2M8B9_RHIMU
MSQDFKARVCLGGSDSDLFAPHRKSSRTLRHSWREDPAGGQVEPSRKSCCLSVPSSLALHTTLGFPISTCKKRRFKLMKNKRGKKTIHRINHWQYLNL